MVSTANGLNKYPSLLMFEYFISFFFAATSAAAPASIHVFVKYEGAKVSTHVASHTKLFPFAQGINVTPSGLLPSFLDNPVGSNIAGMFREVNVRFKMSLISPCL
uniref:Uncharacterized protein n=1 Tax=Cacopsylla melanoneura TaxID=428564 RepID=A0A8D8M036_9HEMI